MLIEGQNIISGSCQIIACFCVWHIIGVFGTKAGLSPIAVLSIVISIREVPNNEGILALCPLFSQLSIFFGSVFLCLVSCFSVSLVSVTLIGCRDLIF
ncbi:unnamed protein product [Meloidogyne enterolobii]|uniref:Uncharacterized protein n=1 Tax=Meloidogyne enterolobii TaxID=390850 RepID=A0ACB0YLQ1_MELEN